MKKEELRAFQLTQLILLDEIEKICKEQNLTYYIIAGTLLGAVRHGGFIPWDYDLDIAMPRPDYQKLKEYFLKNPSDEFFYEDYDTEKYHNSTHAVIRLKNTYLSVKRLTNVEKKRKHNGCFLDVFPLDKAPNDERRQNKQIKKLNRVKKLLYYKEGQVFDDAKRLRNFLKKIVSFILRGYSYKTLGKRLEKIQTKHNYEDSKYLVSMSSRYRYKKQLMAKEIYGVPSRIFFEGKEYNAPQEVIAYLRQLYGDYMKLPPVEKRFEGIEEITFTDNR
ncbi:MAG: LicD family protein [Bacilli bacterium]